MSKKFSGDFPAEDNHEFKSEDEAKATMGSSCQQASDVTQANKVLTPDLLEAKRILLAYAARKRAKAAFNSTDTQTFSR